MTHPKVGGLRGTESRNNSTTGIRKQRGAAASGRRHQPQVESLESRQLLSVAPHDNSAWESAAHVHEEALPFFIPAQRQLHNESGGLLTGPTAGDPRQIAVDYLRANAPLLGISQSDIDTAVVTDQYTDRASGVTHLYFAQTLDGLRLANANMNINITADGRVINAGSSFVSGLDRSSAASRNPTLDARAAVKAAGAAFGLKGTVDTAPLGDGESFRSGEAFSAPAISLDRIDPKLIYVPQPNGGLELSWNLQLRTPDGQHWYDAAVNAGDGKLNWAADWAESASYNVLAAPSENPVDLGRVVVVDPQDSEASPFGWHDTNGVEGPEFTDTRGNNVSAQEDADANDSGGFRPDGGPNLVFDFPFNTALEPTSYREASITNLFYWNNLLHDVHYQYGFDEPSGNFQVNNYGHGGLGNDAVQADAQDGSGTNNANMFTPPDGQSPRMQQYLFTFTSPGRDSSMSNDIITHEFGHGVSNRLTGGPANSGALNALQSGGMGEGWSDWWALMFTQDPADTKFAAYPSGTYVLGQPENGQGIRRYPYSFDMTVDPRTLGFYNFSPEVHDAGEIWCTALWDMNWLLIDKYGYDADISQGYQGPGSAGNLLALQLVMDGLKLQPANPTFTDARDAILLADTVLTGGANAKEIWTAFARRGFGLSADVDDGNGANSFTVVEAFDLPIFDLHVTTTSPGENAIIGTRPTVFDLDFSQDFDPATANASDLLVNGIPATNVQVIDANSLRFSYAGSPVTVEGAQTMTMAAGALSRATDGEASIEFSREFRYDTLRMEITSTSPASGAGVQLPFTTVDVNLNEAIDPASAAASDLELGQGTVTGVQVLDADTVRFTIAGLSAEGTLNFQFDAGAFTDQFGNPSVGFGGSWALDFGTVPFTGAFAPLTPSGSLAYSGATTGIIGVAGDTDTFTLLLQAGQTLAFRATSATGWQPQVTLRDPQGGVLASAGGAASGALLLPATQLNAGGLYSIEVGAPAGAIGSYTVEAMLNVDYETELLPGGATNDTRATAQPLEPLLTSVDSAARRALVIGQAPSAGDLPFEVEPNASPAQANSLMGNFSATSGDVYQLHIDGEQNNSADTDWFNLGTLDAGDVVTISLSGASSQRGTLNDPLLYLHQRVGGSVSMLVYNDDGRPGADSLIYKFTIPATAEYLVEAQDYSFFETGTYDLNVYLENIGTPPATGGNLVNESEGNNDASTADDFSTSWRQVVRESNTSGVIAAADDDDVYRVTLAVGDVITVTAQGQNGFAPALEIIPSRGPIAAADPNFFGFDRAEIFAYRAFTSGAYYVRVRSPFDFTGSYDLKVELSSPTPPAAAEITPDYYSVNLAAGESLSLLIDKLDDQAIELQLQDAAGNVLATGAAHAFDTDYAISDFQVTQAGTYYAVVLAGRAPRYRLLAAVNTTVDIELNDDSASAQLVESSRVDSAQRVLGRIAPAASEVTTYSELSFRPADGLTFNHVTYDFKINGVDSFDANFGSGGPPATKYGDGIGLEGNAAGILTLDFESPTGALQFGVLLSTGGVVPNGVVVDLLDDGGALVTQIPLELRDEGFGFVEALFDYTGAPASRAVLNFNETVAARFFLDNLSFEFGTGVDLFPVTVAELGTLILETATPGDGLGAPGNSLNPKLRLLDGAGNVLGADDDSAADGKNARLQYAIPRGVNTVYVEVSASSADPNSRGDYLLRISNPTSIPAPYSVLSVSPGDGTRLRNQPTQIEVTFAGNFLLDSLDAADLLVDGVAATAVTLVDGAKAKFAAPAGLTEGVHTITLAAGALTDLQGTPLSAFASDFTLDFTAPRLIGASIANGAVLPVGDTTFVFTFSEAMRVENLSFDDFALYGTYRAQAAFPASFAWDATGAILTVQYSNLWEDSFQFTLRSGDDLFEDLVKINLDGEANGLPLPPSQSGDGVEGGDFVVSFSTDVNSAAFPIPLVAVGPHSSTSYRGQASGLMSFAGDVDEFTLQLDAGQSLTLSALMPGLQSSLTFRGPNGATIGTALAPSVGGEAVLRSAPVTSSGLYTIAFASPNGAVGPFSFTAYLNLDVEMEHHGGAVNDNRAAAQDLNPAFVDVGVGGAARANILGTANLPLGVLPFEQEPNNTRETANAAFANFGPGGDLYQMSISGSMFGGRTGADWFAIGAMNNGDVITVNVGGAGSGHGSVGGVRVELYAGEVNNLTLVASDYFGSGAGGDALISQYQVLGPAAYFVQVVYDGVNTGTYELSVFLQNGGRAPRTDGTLTAEAEPNNTPAQANGASNAWRKVDYASFTAATTSPIDSDHFAYDFQAGDLVSTIINGTQGSADTRLVWRGPNGETLGFDDGFSGPSFQNALFYGLRIPTTGRYTLEVLSFSDGRYSAGVYLSSPTAPPTAELTSDFYRLDLTAGEQIALSVKAFAGAENELSIQNAAGVTLLTASLTTENLGTVIPSFVAPTAGVYYVVVRGTTGQQYTLSVAKSAALDAEENNSLATAQALSNSGVALGHVRQGTESGRLFAVALDGSGYIVELDRATGAELNRFPTPDGIPGGPDGLAFDGASLYYINGYGTQQLFELNPDTGAVLDVDLYNYGYFDSLAFLDGKVYVGDYGYNLIYEIDPVADVLLRTIPVQGFFITGGLAGDTDRLIATVNFGQSVIEIDPVTGVGTQLFSTQAIYAGVAVVGNELYLGSLTGGPKIDVFSFDGTFQRTINLPYTVSALGGDSNPADDDWYRIEALPGQYLAIATQTPGGGDGEFVNKLDPAVELYDANGQMLAANDNGPDGRNARLVYQVAAGGVLYVRVRSVTGQGEYVLAVDHVSAAIPGDTDFDGDVDLDDLNNVRNGFGGGGLGDTSPFDGDVDLDDLNAVRNNFGAGGSPALTGAVTPRTAAARSSAALVDAFFSTSPARVSTRSVDELFSLLGADRATRKPKVRNAS